MPEYVGGTELYTHWLATGLSRQGHQVTVFYRRSGPEPALTHRQDDHGVSVWAVTAGPVTPNRRFLATFGNPYILRAFDQVLAQTRPDLIHIQHLQGLPVSLVKQIEHRGIPFVITLHDYWWGCANAQLLTNYSQQLCQGPRLYLNCARCALARAGWPQLWPAWPGLAGLLARRNHLLRPVLQAARKLIAPTRFVAGWYMAQGAPAERMLVMPHGLPIPAGIPRPSQRPARRPIRFGYIGGLTWQKGVHILIEAFNTLPEQAELWVAGDETAEPAYAARLHSLASPRVRFLGKLARADVWQTLARLDVLAVPSIWYETFAFVIAEAFAMGVPVVASRLGPLADRVGEGIDGLLVSPGEVEAWRQALLRFLQEPELLPRLQAGIRPVHTIEAYIKDIEALYQEVLTGSGT